MTDREKVIKGLEIHLKGNSRCKGCPYPNNGLCGDQLMADALALLKAQTPVKPVKSKLSWEHGYNWDIWDCGHCGSQLRSDANYCDRCGKAVKWDG